MFTDARHIQMQWLDYDYCNTIYIAWRMYYITAIKS